MRSSRPKRKAWVWVWRSAARSSRCMVGDCGQRRGNPREVFSNSTCLFPKGLSMKRAREDDKAVVVVIDDDAEIRETLEDLISSVGLEAETFASVQHFLE